GWYGLSDQACRSIFWPFAWNSSRRFRLPAWLRLRARDPDRVRRSCDADECSPFGTLPCRRGRRRRRQRLKGQEMTLAHLHPGQRMSEAVRVGDIVFLAGQIPDDLSSGIELQTRQVLDGIDRVMAELGGSKSDVVSVQVWLADMADFPGMN